MKGPVTWRTSRRLPLRRRGGTLGKAAPLRKIRQQQLARTMPAPSEKEGCANRSTIDLLVARCAYAGIVSYGPVPPASTGRQLTIALLELEGRGRLVLRHASNRQLGERPRYRKRRPGDCTDLSSRIARSQSGSRGVAVAKGREAVNVGCPVAAARGGVGGDDRLALRGRASWPRSFTGSARLCIWPSRRRPRRESLPGRAGRASRANRRRRDCASAWVRPRAGAKESFLGPAARRTPRPAGGRRLPAARCLHCVESGSEVAVLEPPFRPRGPAQQRRRL
jgi:hypothetical protein